MGKARLASSICRTIEATGPRHKFLVSPAKQINEFRDTPALHQANAISPPLTRCSHGLSRLMGLGWLLLLGSVGGLLEDRICAFSSPFSPGIQERE